MNNIIICFYSDSLFLLKGQNWRNKYEHEGFNTNR